MLKYILILSLSVSLFSCKKFVVATTSVTHSNVTYSEASISAKYDITLVDPSEYTGGICWDTLPNPSLSSSGIYQVELKKSRSFNLAGLLSNKRYYLRSYIIKDKEIIYSQQIDFKTIAAPVPPCDVADNIVNFYSDVLMSNLEDQSDFDHYKVRTSSVNGYWLHVDFPTRQIPQTGIYETSLSLKIYGTIPGFPSSCSFSIEEGNTIYVSNLGNDRIKIYFCDLTISSSYPCASSITISGMLKNF